MIPWYVTDRCVSSHVLKSSFSYGWLAIDPGRRNWANRRADVCSRPSRLFLVLWQLFVHRLFSRSPFNRPFSDDFSLHPLSLYPTWTLTTWSIVTRNRLVRARTFPSRAAAAHEPKIYRLKSMRRKRDACSLFSVPGHTCVNRGERGWIGVGSSIKGPSAA